MADGRYLRACFLEISGMTCGSCVKLIEGAVSTTPGVHAVQVSLENGQAVIVYTANSGLTEDALAEAVNDLGFQARLLTIDSCLPDHIPALRGALIYSPIFIQNPPSDWTAINEFLVKIPGVLISRGDSEKGVLSVWHISSMVSVSAIQCKLAEIGLIFRHVSSQLRSSHNSAPTIGRQPNASRELIHLPQGDDELKSANLLLIKDSSNSSITDWTALVRNLSGSQNGTVECVVLAADTNRAVLQVLPRQDIDSHTLSFDNQLDLSKFSRILADRLTASNYPAARIKSVLKHPSTNLPELKTESLVELNALNPTNKAVELQCCIAIYGMHCQSCVKKITARFQEICEKEPHSTGFARFDVSLTDKEIQFAVPKSSLLLHLESQFATRETWLTQLAHDLLAFDVAYAHREIQELGFQTTLDQERPEDLRMFHPVVISNRKPIFAIRN
ncbi:hypothetical protein D915_010448 [Fasciola hepatica]|uniref:HMA domain-containing protein n=1 Tax=Fasciola hepatica TaxID=6192 RepID=A0A4E0QVR6_FASHE|nr:hypothetical protein D915_010448 [Fasciola hepatica]